MGFKPEEALELEEDMARAFIRLYDEENKIEWETRIEVLKKLFGGK